MACVGLGIIANSSVFSGGSMASIGSRKGSGSAGVAVVSFLAVSSSPDGVEVGFLVGPDASTVPQSSKAAVVVEIRRDKFMIQIKVTDSDADFQISDPIWVPLN